MIDRVGRRRTSTHPVSILDSRIDPSDKGVPYVSAAIHPRVERKLNDRILNSNPVEYERHSGSAFGEYGEVNASALDCRSQGQRVAACKLESGADDVEKVVFLASLPNHGPRRDEDLSLQRT
jgi:hypothetical protein